MCLCRSICHTQIGSFILTMTMTMNKFYCHALHKEYRIPCGVIHHYWYNLRYSTSKSYIAKGARSQGLCAPISVIQCNMKGARKEKKQSTQLKLNSKMFICNMQEHTYNYIGSLKPMTGLFDSTYK